MSTQHHTPPEAKILPEDKSHKTQIFIAVIILLSIAMMATSFMLYRRQQNQTVTSKLLTGIQQQVSFPVYYPAQLPAGFRLDINSIKIHSGLVTFSLINGSKVLLVTEQAQPSIKEQIKKTASMTTAYGSAYIANLNGHITGFAESNKTLVIIGNAEVDDTDNLKNILQNLQAVN